MSDTDKKYKGGKRRTMKRKHSKTEYPEDYGCGVTTHGLHKWYASMFEKLGWMILAEHRGYKDKIATYKKSLLRLKNDIEEKIDQVDDHDKKTDLKIMHYNLEVLIKHVNKDF